MTVYHNISVPVPPDATVNHSTGRVFLTLEKIYSPQKKYNKDRRCIIGWINSSDGKTMNPNDN